VSTRTQTVLVVEDDVSLRRVIRQTLTLAGYDVEEAGDGFSALQQIDAHPPDLVVLDLGLPTITGYTVQQEISARPNLRRIPVVVITGLMVNSKPPGVACLLHKPVASAVLLDAVRRCIASACF